MRLLLNDHRLRPILVSSVILGFAVSGGTLVYCGTAAVLSKEWGHDSLFGNFLTILIGAVWTLSPFVTLLVRRKRFDANSEYSPIAGIAVAIVLLTWAIIDTHTPRLMWPWGDYPWTLPALAFGIGSMSFLAMLDRRMLKTNP